MSPSIESKSKSLRWIFASLLLLSQGAWANNHLDQVGSLSQDVFNDLTSDLGSTIGYKALTSGDPTGALGFDIDFEASNTSLESNALDQARSGPAPVGLRIPKVSLQTGLPLGIGFGGFYSNIPTSNISLMGGELSYAFVAGSPATPAVSIRGNFTRLSGVEDFDLMTRGLELSISKGFDAFTPYAGLGTLWIDGETTVDGLSNESLTKNKYFMGFNFNLGLMSFSAETEQTGGDATTSAKFGLRF